MSREGEDLRKLETEINTIKQEIGFDRKRIAELEQVIEKHKKDIFNLKGNEQAHALMWENKEKLNTIEAVLKKTH